MTTIKNGDPARRRRRMSAGVGCLALLGLTLGAVGHVAVHAKHLEVGLERGREFAVEKELLAERKKLEIEIQMLKHPALIERLAREKLRMGPADFQNLRVIPALTERTP